MSLRAFHLVFILIAMIGADVFGAWAIHEWRLTGEWTTLALGAISLVGGLGLAAYSAWFVVKLEKAHIA